MSSPKLSRTSARAHSRTGSRQTPSLAVERLEDRTVPSVVPFAVSPELPAATRTDVADPPAPDGRAFTRTEVMVGFTSADPLADVAAAAAADPVLGAMIDPAASGELIPGEAVSVYTVALKPGTDPLKAVARLQELGFVGWAAPNYMYAREGTADPRDYTPNDPQYGNQYHHPLMDNDLAWNGPPTTPFFGSPGIIVAVTDDGIDIDHPDLAPNVWVNDDPVNGVDDDGNGFVDDLNGWDFVNNNNNPRPNVSGDSHGTHVAGILAARTDNGIGVAGTAGHVTIMPLQWLSNGAGFTSAIIAASYRYATDNGAKIVSTSYNVDGFVSDPTFLAGLNYLYAAGVLHINSAGNNNQNNPPRQVMNQSIFVASTGPTDVKSSFSNYGFGVDVAAPGDNILSTLLNGTYGFNSGTSMATPNVAGVAALIWSKNPTWTREQVVAQLLGTADNIDAQNPSFAGLLGSGRVNSFRALNETLAAPRIEGVPGLPPEGGNAGAILTTFGVDLSGVMDPASVVLGNFELRGDGADNTFGTPDDTVIPLTFPAGFVYQVGVNRLTLNIGPGLVPDRYRFTAVSGGLQDPFGTDLDGDANGSPGGNFTRTFTYEPDLIAPRITGLSLVPNATLAPGNLTVQVTFSEPMLAANLDATDITLVGTHRGVSYTSASRSFNAAGTVLTINYTNLPDDRYTLSLLSANGRFEDVTGNDLDGEFASLTLPSGNGVAGGNFVVPFTIDLATEAFPTLNARAPTGGMVYDNSLVRTIAVAGDADDLTLNVDPGQTLAVRVTPNTTGLRPTIELLDPSGVVVASATAAAAGQLVNLAPQGVPAGGTYTVRVTGAGGTVGRYTVQVVLNGALEGELPGGSANNTPAMAQNLDGGFLGLNTSLASATRAAVLGAADVTPAGYAAAAVTPAFTDISATGTRATATGDDAAQTLSGAQLAGFTFPFFGTTFTAVSFNTNGLITFGGANSDFSNGDLSTNPTQAAIAALWDDLFNANTAAQGIFWQVVGSGASQQLIIQWHNVTQLGGTAQFSFQAVLSRDGTIQLNYGPTVGSSGVVQSATVGVKGAGTTNPPRLLVSLNQAPGALVGSSLSTRIAPVSIPPVPDYYSFTGSAGQTITAALATLAAGNADVQLLAADGTTVLASGTAGATNLNEAIQNFALPVAGTYYLKVTGQGNLPYDLVVLKDAAFDAEANDTAATAQPLGGSRGVLGNTQGGGGTAYDFETGQQGWTINNTILGTGTAAGLWNLTTRRGTDPNHSPVTSFYYGNPATGNFATGARNAGAIVSPTFVVAAGANVSFKYFLATEGGTSFDQATVQVSINGGASWTTVLTPLAQSGTFTAASASLAAFAGQTVQVRFLFDTIDSVANAFEGWYVDDVQFGTVPDPDWYAVTLAADQTALRVETSTPADGPGQFTNTLNPKVEVYDSTGTTLLGTGTALGDGRNEAVTVTGLTAGGTYTIRVVGEGTTGGTYFVGATALRTPAITSRVDDGLPSTWGPDGSFAVPNPVGYGWANVTGAGWQNDYTRWTYDPAKQGPTNFANWNVKVTPDPVTGAFELFASWVPRPQNATNATYEVREGTVLRGTVVVDQTRAPNDALLFGTTLAESLGRFTKLNPATTFFNVRLVTAGANGDLVADGVFDPPAAAAAGGPTPRAGARPAPVAKSPAANPARVRLAAALPPAVETVVRQSVARHEIVPVLAELPADLPALRPAAPAGTTLAFLPVDTDADPTTGPDDKLTLDLA